MEEEVGGVVLHVGHHGQQERAAGGAQGPVPRRGDYQPSDRKTGAVIPGLEEESVQVLNTTKMEIEAGNILQILRDRSRHIHLSPHCGPHRLPYPGVPGS